MYASNGGLDLLDLFINFLKLVVGLIALWNIIDRMPKKLHKASAEDLKEIRSMLTFPITAREEAKLKITNQGSWKNAAIKAE